MHRNVAVILLFSFLTVSVFASSAAEQAAAGRAALDRNEPEKAAALFERAIALDPKNAELHYLLGSAHGRAAENAGILKAGSLAKKARESWEKAVTLDPAFIDARFALVQFYIMAPGFMGGSEEKALAHAAEIKKRDSFEGHRAYARIYTSQKKHDLARSEMVEAVREQPNNPRGHYYLGSVYMSDKKWAAAQHEYEFALKLDPAYMPPHFRLGQIAAKTGKDYARGEESLRKYLTHKPGENEPSLAAAWYWLGQLQQKQGRNADAKTSYANGLKLAPNDKDLTSALRSVS